jgi:hypothetical protein
MNSCEGPSGTTFVANLGRLQVEPPFRFPGGSLRPVNFSRTRSVCKLIRKLACLPALLHYVVSGLALSQEGPLAVQE